MIFFKKNHFVQRLLDFKLILCYTNKKDGLKNGQTNS